jgi:hypothetical protein
MPWPTCEEGYLKRKLTLFASQVVNDFKTIPSLSGGGILEAIARFEGPWWFCNHWLPAGMVENGIQGSGSIGWQSYCVQLKTGTSGGSLAWIRKMFMGFSPGAYDWSKKRYLGIAGTFYAYTNQYVHLVTGDIKNIGGPANGLHHVGFKLIDGDLYGTVGNGTAESTLLLETLAGAVFRRLECVFTPGVECRFYVNGVDKGAITTNLPSGDSGSYYALYASVYNTADENKQVDIVEWRVLREE